MERFGRRLFLNDGALGHHSLHAYLVHNNRHIDLSRNSAPVIIALCDAMRYRQRRQPWLNAAIRLASIHGYRKE